MSAEHITVAPVGARCGCTAPTCLHGAKTACPVAPVFRVTDDDGVVSDWCGLCWSRAHREKQ